MGFGGLGGVGRHGITSGRPLPGQRVSRGGGGLRAAEKPCPRPQAPCQKGEAGDTSQRSSVGGVELLGEGTAKDFLENSGI